MPNLCINSSLTWTGNRFPPFLVEDSGNGQFIISQIQHSCRPDPRRRCLSWLAPNRHRSCPTLPGRGPRGGKPGLSLGRCSRTRGGWDWASGLVSTLGWNRRTHIVKCHVLKNRPSKTTKNRTTQDTGKWHAQHKLCKIHIHVNVFGNTFFHLFKFLCTNPGLQCSIISAKRCKASISPSKRLPIAWLFIFHVWPGIETPTPHNWRIPQPDWNRWIE